MHCGRHPSTTPRIATPNKPRAQIASERPRIRHHPLAHVEAVLLRHVEGYFGVQAVRDVDDEHSQPAAEESAQEGFGVEAAEAPASCWCEEEDCMAFGFWFDRFVDADGHFAAIAGWHGVVGFGPVGLGWEGVLGEGRTVEASYGGSEAFPYYVDIFACRWRDCWDASFLEESFELGVEFEELCVCVAGGHLFDFFYGSFILSSTFLSGLYSCEIHLAIFCKSWWNIRAICWSLSAAPEHYSRR